jgi:hypothetical protein
MMTAKDIYAEVDLVHGPQQSVLPSGITISPKQKSMMTGIMIHKQLVALHGWVCAIWAKVVGSRS